MTQVTAQFVVVRPADGAVGDGFGVAADDTGARYVFRDGSDSGQGGLDNERISSLAKRFGVPTKATDWLNLALANTGYNEGVASGQAETLDAAAAQALDALKKLPEPPSPAVVDAGFHAPQTREELMAFQRNATDVWSQQYPEAAAGDVDDPEADLALVQLMTPPVDPEQPHKWLPIATTELDCGFCDQPANAAIHTAGADTITRGSN